MRCRATILLLIATAFLAGIPVASSEPQGSITYQENILSEVDVRYEQYTFIFEYKQFFIRLKPFIIYNGQYYGMEAIVTWIKNNYPSINYKWLVDKAEEAIHYGFNLTKLPQKVADKVDFLGFRLVDLNFPVSWFKLETVLAQDADGLPYNETIIQIPRANLQFGFGDLYPYGYDIIHVNSTYILIGNVKGQTDLIMDPITYSSPTITIIGGSEGSELDFEDIYDADQAGGWDVFLKLNTSKQYMSYAQLYFGNDTSAGETWFKDTLATLYWNPSAFPSGNVAGMWTSDYCHVQFGTLLDAETKACNDGCTFYLPQKTGANVYTMVSTTYDTEAYVKFYGCTFIHHDSAHTIGHYGNVELFECNLFSGGEVGGGIYTVTNSRWNISRVVFSKSLRAIQTFGLLAEFQCNDLEIREVNRGFYFLYGGNVTVSNVDIDGVTVFGAYRINDHKWMVNIESDDWDNTFWSGDPVTYTGTVYRQYTMDLNVTDQAGNPLEGATVTVKHYGQGEMQDFSVSTGSNGSFATETLTMGFFNHTGNATMYDYNPFNIEVSKAGQFSHSFNFTLDNKIDWTIALGSQVTIVSGGDSWRMPSLSNFKLVVDASNWLGRKLSDINVTMIDEVKNTTEYAVTGTNGTCEWFLPVGVYRFQADINGEWFEARHYHHKQETISFHWTIYHDLIVIVKQNHLLLALGVCVTVAGLLIAHGVKQQDLERKAKEYKRRLPF